MASLGQLCPRPAAAATWPASGDDPGQPANPLAVMSRPPAHAPDPLRCPVAHCTNRFAAASGRAIMAGRAPPLAAGAHVVQSRSTAGFPPTTRQESLQRIFTRPRLNPRCPTPSRALPELTGHQWRCSVVQPPHPSLAGPNTQPSDLTLSPSQHPTISLSSALPHAFFHLRPRRAELELSRHKPKSTAFPSMLLEPSPTEAEQRSTGIDGFPPLLGHSRCELHLHIEPYTPVIPVAAKLHVELRLRPVKLTLLSAPHLNPRSRLPTSPELAALPLTVDEPCRFATILETYPKRLAVSPSSFSPTSPAPVRRLLAGIQGTLADGTYKLVPANKEEAPEGGADVIVIDPETDAGVAQEGKPRSIT
nr:unnamed protein product [Digitaria exilis]